MDKNKKICKCSKKKQKVCKHPTLKACTDVSEIVEALTCGSDVDSGPSRCPSRPKFTRRQRVRREPHPVPMAPAMHSRLQYIGHCPIEHKLKPIDSKTKSKYYSGLDFSSTDEEPCNLSTCPVRKKAKKKVHYYNNEIIMPLPQNVALQGSPDKNILNVGSPKTSGEVIQVQKTVVKPREQRPPLPASSGHQLFKPHSGIVINRQGDYVPDVVNLAPLPLDGLEDRHPKHPCDNKSCRRKRCIHYRRSKQAKKSKKNFRGSCYRKGRRSVGTSKYRVGDDEACGPDEIPKPEQIRIPCNLKRGTIQTHSLTVLPCTKDRKPDIHYGILTGSFNMYDAKFGARSRGRQALPMSVMAYCLAFHYHPKQWTMKLLDNLLDAGDKWYLQCADKVHDHSAVQGICEVLPFGKKQTLVLNGKRMQILLGEPEIVGYTMSLDPTVYNLCRGLKAYFKENRAGILLSRVLKVVIWKDKVCYYIFDPAGRDTRGYSNFTTGAAALINVKDVESVAEVLLARSILEDQKFVLAPVKCLKMINEQEDDDLESDKELTQAEKAMMGYRILNENCAIVNANMHLGDRCFEDAKFRQALPIAVMAMTYAKISPPNTWHTKTLDKILRLGNKLYVDCSNPKVMTDMVVDNIPNEIIIGPYASEIIIYRERTKGQLFTTKECLLNIRTGLKDFFSKEYNSGILQFNNFSLGIWKQKDMFYLFDPYPRTSDGLTTTQGGKACVLMLLNPEAMATSLEKNWEYLPVTTQFCIHAFKVLKLKKKDESSHIRCSLSDDELPAHSKKVKRTVLPEGKGRGDYDIHDILPARTAEAIEKPLVPGQPDEEHMGDIVSLVDSIQEDYLPPIPLRYKKPEAEKIEDKLVNLDSPTVSVTQIVPPWPKPRDKSTEQPDLDPEPEPEPEPEPPPAPVPEDAEEEELGEEEELARQRREEERKRLEEEAKNKAIDLPPPISPPPPTPQEDEPQLAIPPPAPPEPTTEVEEEIPAMEFVRVDRRVLLTEDARVRHKLRQQRRKISQPLVETDVMTSAEYELKKPSNFKEVLDGTQIIRGSSPVLEHEASDVLPFTAIMAIITSYKYSINTWTPGIVNFVQDAARKLYQNKQQKFQLAPIHIIPYIALGKQAYQANIDVIGEGPTWRLEDILERKFFQCHDRGMITTSNYSCAVFIKNGLYYLYDGSHCNGLGIRHCTCSNCSKGKPAFMRFTRLHDLANRIVYNKDGPIDDQQFILSRVVVRNLCKEARLKLPEDYSYETGRPKSKKSTMTVVDDKIASIDDADESQSSTQLPQYRYRLIDGAYRIEGTTALRSFGGGFGSSDVKACHFISLIAMLMATMHPIRTWDHVMVDTVVEKGIEIFNKAKNTNVCEKRVIKNIILDGKFIDVNIKRLLVVNENRDKTLEQYLNAVLKRLRYVIIRFPQASMVICQVDGFYHLFDPYPSVKFNEEQQELVSDKTSEVEPRPGDKASWTLYRCMNTLILRLKKTISKDINSPEFYTFELTSIKNAPRNFAITYRLSPLFKPEKNPNMPYMKSRRIHPTVDEKMYWLSIEEVPWSRMTPVNDVGFERKLPQSMWKDWDIEFPGDLFSLWGSVHPRDSRFADVQRGKQYLHVYAVALATTETCELGAWTSNLLDGIVIAGDKFYKSSYSKIQGKTNVELTPNDVDGKFDEYPYSYNFKFEKVIFGFMYNIYPDRFNLSKALVYFFEKNDLGILVSASKNLAFGRVASHSTNDQTYFMLDCQSFGAPIFVPGQGAAYILKCESLNRLIYCITITMNLKRHGQLFHLFNANITINEK